MKKRLTSILLTLAMVASLLPAMGGTARADTTLEWDHFDAVDNKKFFKESNVTATLSGDGKTLTISGGNITTNPEKSNRMIWPWDNYGDIECGDIETVVITGSLTVNGSLNDMFSLKSKLTSITGLNNLNTANVTDMSSMFSGCSSLTSLDLSGFNTSNVTNMSGMFSECSSLTSLDLNNFNTSSVTNMSRMFSECSSLTSLNLSNFNTSNVTSASFMIPTALKYLTLPANFCPNASNANFTHDMVNSSDYTAHYSNQGRIPCDTSVASYTACYPIKYYSIEGYNSGNGQAYKDSANFPSGTTVPSYYVYGQSVALPPTPVRTGYRFLGWYFEKTSGYLSNTKYTYDEAATGYSNSTTGEKSYYAKWETIPYSITYDLGGGSVSTANPTSFTVETTSFTLTNPTRSGYEFASWTGSNGSTPQTTVTITKGSTGDKTYTANWTEISPWKGLQYAITNGTSLENVVSVSGTTITLLRDITAAADDSCLTVPSGKTVTIDLNGHTIDRHLTTATANGNVITVKGSLTVTDSGTGGAITGGWNTTNGGGVFVDSGTFTMMGGCISGNTADDNGGGVYVTSSGTFNMTGAYATVTGNTALGVNDTNTNGGGGVYVDSGSFTMSNGKITHNTANRTTGTKLGMYGGGVYVAKTFTMSGGEISGNTCTTTIGDAWGGGVYVKSSGTFTMSGGTITGNNAGTATNGYGGGVFDNSTFKLSGNPTISGNVVGGSKNGTIYTGGTASNIYLNGKKITVNGTLTGGAGSIGVSMKTPGEFTNSATTAYNDATKFASNMSGYSVEKDGSTNQLKLVANAVNYNINITDTISNGTVTCDKTTATAGETITLTVTPATGYALSTISVTKDGDSNTSLAVSGSGSSYTFTMPAFAVNVTASFALIPATAPVIFAQPSNLSLTVGYAAGSVSVAASAADGHTLGYQWYSNTSNSSTGGTSINGANDASYPIPTGKNAGTYYYYCVVTATRTDNSQTASTTSGVAVVTVGKGAPTYTAPTALTLTYDGGEQALVTAGNTSHGTITYSTSENGSYTGTIPTGINAGDYEVWWKLTGDENHSNVVPTKLSPKIDLKEVTVSGITAGDKTYDGTTAATLDTSGAVFDGIVTGDTLTVTATGTFADANAGGEKTVTITNLTLGGTSAGNYQLASSGQQTNATANITAKNITVTADAQSKTYGDADPALTYTTNGLVSGDALSGSLTRTVGEGVGEYNITQGTLSAGNNYTITYQGAKLTIAPKTLTVTAEAKSKTYGDADPALTYTVSGLVGTDALTGNLSRATGENAGTYAIGQGTLSAGDNYAINYTGANLTIGQKEVGLSWGNTSFTYNTTPQKPTATATGLVGNDTCAVTVTGEQTDVGSYTATASGLSNGNYKLPSANTQSFTIAPKTVDAPTIELSPSSFVYDGSAKEPTVTVKDGGTVIPAGEYTVSCSNNTNVGTATVTITDKDGGNYIVNGSTTFDITRAAPSLSVSITGWTYGETANAPTLTGNAENGAVTWEYTVRGADSYSETVPTDAGAYTVRASVAETANYAAGTATADFTIAKAALTITAKPHTIVKGDAPVGGGVTYSGFMNDEDESVLGGELAYAYNTDGSTAGVSFTITPSGLTSGNYAITYVPGTLTVKDTYAVTYYRNFAADDDEITETQTKVEDSDLTLSLPAAARTGYTLDGWFSARSGGTRRADDAYTDNAALDLYAHWTANSYTVKFNANGGTGEMDDMAFTYDVAQTLTSNAFTRSAYNFVGWAATSDGAVEWNDGVTAQNLTAEEDGTFTLYAVWTAKPVYTVSGTVVGSDHTPIGNVAVKLMRGNEEIASTVTAADGMYVFNAPADTYNIVATWQKDESTAVTKTQLVVLNADKSYELVMPNGKTNSVLELKGDDTPPVVVGGLDNEAAAVKAEAEGNTTSDTKKVTVTMTVESKDEAEVSTDATAIKTVASGRTLDYLAITVEKDVDNVKTGITETANVLEIVVPYNFSGKQTVEVYRCHGTDAEAMTALDAQPDNEHPAADGKFWLDKDNGLIYIYARNFSTYAIGYTVPAPTYFAPTTYPPSIPDTPHGELTASPTAPKTGDKVTVTPKPDDGFAVDTVTVTGPDGKIVPVTDNGDGTYTFTQPSGKAKIEVTFKARSLEPYGDCAQDDTCPISAFTDTDPTAWYHDGAHWAIENGVMNGVGDGLFLPNGTTSRAMLAQILYNMDDKPTIRSGIPFEDVSASDWYAMAISWAKSNGIIDGYGNGKFGPNDDLTREQLVTIIYRYAKKKGINVSVGEDTNILSYDDTFDVSEWAISAMQWAVGSGLVSGRTASTLNPQDKTTRAEIATIIMRYCTEVAR